MFNKIKILSCINHVVLSLFFFCAIISGAYAQATNKTTTQMSNEEYVVALINYIRLDPLGYAEAIGYNRDTLLTTLPWLAAASYGLESFESSEFLNRKAAEKNSSDPALEEPVPTVVNDFAFTGNLDGVISFVNYMNPWDAINLVVNNQLNKELDPLNDGERYILSSIYNRVGTSFRGDTLYASNSTQNAYFIIVCFGSSLLKSEVQVVNLINQMRANPSESYKYLNLNTTFLSGNFQPLFLNDSLRSTAVMGLSSNGLDFPGIALYYGFTGTKVVESSILDFYPNISPNLYALSIFAALVLNEIKFYPSKNTIFNSDYNEIGPAVYYVDGNTNDYSKLTLATGVTAKHDPAVSRIYGLVYKDVDNNNTYTPGEDAPDRLIVAYNKKNLEIISTATTNNAGQFTMNLPNNTEYIIQTGTVENLARKDIYLTSDMFYDLKVN